MCEQRTWKQWGEFLSIWGRFLLTVHFGGHKEKHWLPSTLMTYLGIFPLFLDPPTLFLREEYFQESRDNCRSQDVNQRNNLTEVDCCDLQAKHLLRIKTEMHSQKTTLLSHLAEGLEARISKAEWIVEPTGRAYEIPLVLVFLWQKELWTADTSPCIGLTYNLESYFNPSFQWAPQ